MKTQSEIVIELKSVRAALAGICAEEGDADLMYGAQQALIWMLDEGDSPSHLQRVINELSETFDN